MSEEVTYGYFHGYRLLDRNGDDPEFPFGYGLSYTTFELPVDALSYYDAENAAWVLEPLEYLVEVGTSARSLPLSQTLTVD